jgi:hypothetical protein
MGQDKKSVEKQSIRASLDELNLTVFVSAWLLAADLRIQLV